MKRFVYFLGLLIILSYPSLVWAGPSSSNYELKQYSFGSGGSSTDMQSANSRLFGNSGEVEFDPSSTNYTFQGGLNYSLQTSTPLTPTLTNPSAFYDRLHGVINPGTDPSDTTYAIAISLDNFVTTNYITSANTLSSTLDATMYQTYAGWGSSAGFIVTGLDMESTYQIKVKAVHGVYTESSYSAAASAITDVPNLTLSLSGDVDMGTWNDANAYSTTATSTVTTSTNAYNGYLIYAYATGNLTRINGTETIPAYSGTYAAPASWATGQGFGYTTNDTDISGVAKWNATPCPGDGGSPLCYAAFATSGPGNVIADHEASTGGQISNEAFLVSYKVVTASTQVAGKYSTTIVYTATPSF
jgi:hypothetical protein